MSTEDSPMGDIVDPSTGLPRAQFRKCDTCIYRPGNLMHLDEGRRDALESAAVERGSWIVCHETLPEAGAVEQAICRGFLDVAGSGSWGVRLARTLAAARGLDWPACAEVDPSTTRMGRHEREVSR